MEKNIELFIRYAELFLTIPCSGKEGDRDIRELWRAFYAGSAICMGLQRAPKNMLELLNEVCPCKFIYVHSEFVRQRYSLRFHPETVPAELKATIRFIYNDYWNISKDWLYQEGFDKPSMLFIKTPDNVSLNCWYEILDSIADKCYGQICSCIYQGEQYCYINIDTDITYGDQQVEEESQLPIRMMLKCLITYLKGVIKDGTANTCKIQ